MSWPWNAGDTVIVIAGFTAAVTTAVTSVITALKVGSVKQLVDGNFSAMKEELRASRAELRQALAHSALQEKERAVLSSEAAQRLTAQAVEEPKIVTP